jgi:hypothetical protein
MAWFAVEEDGKLITFAEGPRGKEPGGYDDPRFTLTKLSRKPNEDDEFVDGQLRKRQDAADLRAARSRPTLEGLEQRVAELERQVAAVLAARPA